MACYYTEYRVPFRNRLRCACAEGAFWETTAVVSKPERSESAVDFSATVNRGHVCQNRVTLLHMFRSVLIISIRYRQPLTTVFGNSSYGWTFGRLRFRAQHIRTRSDKQR